MGRDRKPKHKLSRREGRDLFGTGGPSLQHRLNQPPGMHGKVFRKRQTQYAEQLREKQKVKRIYGLREAQMQRFYAQALRSRDVTGIALLKLLERRLDNVVFRLGFARTRLQARQFVRHGHVQVDGKRVDIPSFLVEPGQEIQLSQASLGIPDLVELAEIAPPTPAWLERRPTGGIVLRQPEREEIDPDINETRIVEFYSR